MLSIERAAVEAEGIPHAREDEWREFKAVGVALSNSSRLLRLFTYIGEKYFEGQTQKLHEYDIATEVFGRSKSTFNPGEDAIVRVEAHRLRKKLKEYYEGEGKDHPVQVSLPAGSYVPAFIHRHIDTGCPVEPQLEVAVSPPPKRRRWAYVAAACAALLMAALIGRIEYRHRQSEPAKSLSTSAATVPPIVVTGQFAQLPLHILAGDYGKPQVDAAGMLWHPDTYAHNGGNWTGPADSVLRTSDPLLFEHWRNGDFSYEIPLKPGVYELHLYFLDVRSRATSPSTFSVTANGHPLLSGFDIYGDAGALNTADERIFRDISPGSDGMLHLSFATLTGTAELNAISILPGLAHKQLPIRIVAQPNSYTDHDGNLWSPDNYYLGGYVSAKSDDVTGTEDPDLYSGERYGNFSYAIPVVPGDSYTLTLHFAERYFGQNAPGGGGVGSRVFRVLCNGQILLNNFDIYKQAGSFHALSETFHGLKASPQGKLNITFQAIVNNATVSAIEVTDESH